MRLPVIALVNSYGPAKWDFCSYQAQPTVIGSQQAARIRDVAEMLLVRCTRFLQFDILR